MKFEINSKQIIIAIIAILIIASSIYFYKVYSENQYEMKVQELKNNIYIAAELSEKVTNEYSDIWRKQINSGFNGTVYVDGDYKNFWTAEDALKYKMDKIQESGILYAIDSLSTAISENIRSISPPPSKYINIHERLISLYSDCNEYITLAKSPTGSLMSFISKKSELSASIIKKAEEITLQLPKDDNLIKKFSDVQKSIDFKQAKNREKAEEIRLKSYLPYKNECVNFLSSNKKRNSVITTASGLQYEIIKKGTGSLPSNTSKVKVNYHGTLIDGTVFDSSVERKEPVVFPVNEVIKGWTEALKLMPVGSKYKLYVPQELAYGSADRGVIKPYSMLIFDVELLSIIK